jgi:hypothetical protein
MWIATMGKEFGILADPQNKRLKIMDDFYAQGFLMISLRDKDILPHPWPGVA